MFCARCGQQIPEASEICPLCGREATVKLIPVTEPIAREPRFSRVPTPAIQGPSGVGGWLLFFCVSLVVLAPAFTLINLSRMAFSLQNLYYLANVAQVLYAAVVGGMLWTRRPGSFLFLRIYFVLVAAQIGLNAAEMFALALREYGSVWESDRFTRLLVGAGVALLWFAYFRKSVRVRNTYGANL